MTVSIKSLSLSGPLRFLQFDNASPLNRESSVMMWSTFKKSTTSCIQGWMWTELRYSYYKHLKLYILVFYVTHTISHVILYTVIFINPPSYCTVCKVIIQWQPSAPDRNSTVIHWHYKTLAVWMSLPRLRGLPPIWITTIYPSYGHVLMSKGICPFRPRNPATPPKFLTAHKETGTCLLTALHTLHHDYTLSPS